MRHAKDRMLQRRLTTLDLENVVEGGRIDQEGEQEGGRWTYRIETHRMAVVVAFRCDGDGLPAELVVVTAWRKS